MKKQIILLFNLALFVFSAGYGQQAEISGKVKLDTSWARKFFVCRIPGFDQMFTASDALIIARGDIDGDGNFKTRFSASVDEGLYRLHFIKKNDPASTLIIGSKDENHVFFIAGPGKAVVFETSVNEPIIRQTGISGGNANQQLNKLFKIIKNDALKAPALDDSLLTLGETSNSELLNLLAIHYTGNLTDAQKSRVNSILAKTKKESAYGAGIFREYQSSYDWALFLAAGLILALTIAYAGYYFYRQRVGSKIRKILSQREIDTVKLILEGKSNKEIATVFNIELSTVKTHVNNIYAKLRVNNRKDLNRYKRFLDK